MSTAPHKPNTMTSSPPNVHRSEDIGVEVQMPPSYWDKWTPGWGDDVADASDAASVVDDDASASSGNVTGSRMSIKKKSLLAISIAAVSIGGTFFALNGTKNTATKAVDMSKLHKVEVDALDLCEDVRRVLVVPGSEEFQPVRESSNKARHMRILNLKGSSAERRKKCVRNREKKRDDDKCAPKRKPKKTSTKDAERKLGQPSSFVTTRSPGPTLCKDDSGEDNLPDKPRVDPLPATEPPTPSPRRTSAPTKAIITEATPAPSKKEVETDKDETDQPTKVTPSPTPVSTDQPTKVTPSPTPVSTTTNQPTNCESTETGFLGYKLAVNGGLKLLVNEGLEVKRIAEKKQKVQFINGKDSDITYHEWMDGAGVIPLDEGGYVYVSNSENDDRLGGVWGLYFNANHEIVGFKKLLNDTTWNCSGGVSPWKTWISCEETPTGQCYEVDPDPSSEHHEYPKQTLLGGTGGQYEAVAVDDRGINPVFFVTEDKSNGALRRVESSCSGWGALHGTLKGCTLKTTYLRLRPNQNPPSFTWADNESVGKTSAANHFPNSEGIAFHDGKLSFVSKTKKKMFTLDLDAGTYEDEKTGLKFRGKGSFKGQPDQTLDDPDSNYMYFTEEDGMGVGVYARHDKDGCYSTLFEDTGARAGDETVGTATSPDGTRLYVGFQESGELFVVERTDGGRF